MTDDPDDKKDRAAYWSLQIELAQKHNKDFIDNGRRVVKRYKSEKDGILKRNTNSVRRFNILFSNTEVLRSALYGKAAKPDVRRRFGDQDQTARAAADIVERALIYCAETYDVDKPIDAGVLDYLLPGRGTIRVEYEPVLKERPSIDAMTGMPATDAAGEPAMEEFIADQLLREKYVFWEDYLAGPARSWENVPWNAFRHTMSRDELKDNNFKNWQDVPLNWSPDIEGRKEVPEELKKAEVWEIWEKDSRKRYWIVKGYPTTLRTDDDPYGLADFWPMPEPVSSYTSTDTNTPTPEFHAYSDQADDLDEITARISKLTRALKRRGVYDQSIKELKRLSNAGDNEFIPVENYKALSEKGGIQAAFQSEDISLISKVLVDLYKQRDMLVQAIYEVTGIADVMRGNSDPNETLGAQQLKAQFGSSRLKRRQRAIQKWIRDIYKIKAEIIAEHFEPQVLQDMTGDEITPEIMQLLRSDKLRSYRIDIETDSTIFEDAEGEKKSRTELVVAITTFMEKWGPIVQAQPVMIPLAFELLSFALGGFKAGKGVEDAIEQAKTQLEQMAAQKAANPQPNPEQIKAEGEKQKQAMEMQHTQQLHGLKMQEMGAGVLVDQVKLQNEQQRAAMQPAPVMMQ